MRSLALGARALVARVRPFIAFAALASLAIAAACGGDGATGPTTGSLTLALSGLPASVAASVGISGPNGYAHTSAGPETLSDLAPGQYVITAQQVSVAGVRYAPATVSQTVNVAASRSATTASISYALASGSVAIAVNGVPAGSTPVLTLTGPNGFSRAVVNGDTLVGLDPGTYTLAAAPVVSGGNTYGPSPTTQSITLTASLTPASMTVSYAIASGSLVVTIGGLPAGNTGTITITGPNGYSKTLTSTATISNLVPGTYTIVAAPVAVNGDVYKTGSASQTVTVVASTTPIAVTESYAIASGSLALVVSGLPNGVAGSVTVSGPASYNRTLASTTTIPGLTPGAYTINAASVTQGVTRWDPAPASQTVQVTASLAATPATVTYAIGTGSAPGADLSIDGLYLTQATQTYAGAVPLIANRDAFIRVFVKASTSNTAQPSVRVRFYNGVALLNTIVIPPTNASVPITVDEGTLASSWNASVPASLLQPGISILADVDPANAITESNEANNTFPANGTPLALDVRTVAPLPLRFVPVTQTVNGLTGRVDATTANQFLTVARKLLPVQQVNIDVRVPYSTSLPALDANDTSRAWLSLLAEMNALRVADGASQYYYGVVRTTYVSGVAGYGYVPGSAAIGWDYLPSGASIAAHEIAHNLSRQHAPCGGAANPDLAFPYPNGTIGVYGYDLALKVLHPPTDADLMGYCGFTWISDYNFVGMLTYRQNTPNSAIASAAAVAGRRTSTSSMIRHTLLVWGEDDGRALMLEPAFAIDTRSVEPVSGGAYHVEALDAGGRSLLAYDFDGDAPADAPNAGTRHFAFALPLTASTESRIASLRLSRAGRATVTIDSRLAATGGIAGGTPVADATRAGNRDRIRWSDARLRMALVRDRMTGQVLSFARGTAADVAARGGDYDVVLSDGVRSVQRRVVAK